MNKLEQILTDVGHPEVYKKLKEVGITHTGQIRIKARNNPNFLKDFGIEDPLIREKVIHGVEGNMYKSMIITFVVGIVGLILLLLFL
jgi:hypothetical protein